MTDYTFEEYPKWVYPVGIKEVYEAGEEPVLVQSAEEDATLVNVQAEPETKRRGRPAKAVEAE
ncbi:hypothetical protein UFOVP607_55 [uncultured Caudovirales phage]|uniref:Uncharacterized protein n=1 Tax=uncultured Caudovirales phage TaxID=2100421 RepID=A0A6J5N3B0_9CAUD|nr:hypothetical protein UFOVP607_55 [uncultured Caudovirales phage]